MDSIHLHGTCSGVMGRERDTEYLDLGLRIQLLSCACWASAVNTLSTRLQWWCYNTMTVLVLASTHLV